MISETFQEIDDVLRYYRRDETYETRQEKSKSQCLQLKRRYEVEIVFRRIDDECTYLDSI